MPNNTLKPCLGTKDRPLCGVLSYKPRCPRCIREYERDYKKTARPHYNARERKRRAEAVREHRRRFGNVCFGYKRLPHHATRENPLTADHVTPVAAGGAEDGPLAVLCLSCNARKGGRLND